MHPHSIPVLFFSGSIRTHTGSNKSTCPLLIQRKQVYMPIQVGQVGKKQGECDGFGEIVRFF